MGKMTKVWILSIACVALAIGSGACGADDDNDGGSGGAGGVATGGSGGSGGSGGTGGSQGLDTVSGHVQINPLAADLTDLPSLEGVDVRLVDAAKALANPTDIEGATLASTTTDASGAFTMEDVDFSEVTLGVVLTVAGDDLTTSTIAFCDPSDPALPCESTTDARGFAVPSAFSEELETNLGNDTLVADGYVLGLALGPTGDPEEGVSIDAGTAPVTFLAEDLTDAETSATTPSGGFVILPGGVQNVTPTKAGLDFTPESQSVGRLPTVAFQVIFRGETSH